MPTRNPLYKRANTFAPRSGRYADTLDTARALRSSAALRVAPLAALGVIGGVAWSGGPDRFKETARYASNYLDTNLDNMAAQQRSRREAVDELRNSWDTANGISGKLRWIDSLGSSRSPVVTAVENHQDRVSAAFRDTQERRSRLYRDYHGRDPVPYRNPMQRAVDSVKGNLRNFIDY